jgi:hypothetical protein
MADGMYYFRNAAESLPMEHYQVADAFGKRQRPILKPVIELSSFDSGNNIVEVTYSVANYGHSLAKWIMTYLTFNLCRRVEPTAENFWQNIKQEQTVDGSEEWVVGYESPVLVLHPNMVKPLGKVKVHLESPLVLISVTVGAEGATTDNYLTIISREWLAQKARSPEYQAKARYYIPTLACGSNFSLDELDKFSSFAGPVKKDLESMSPESVATIAGVAMSEIGDDAILTILQKAQAFVEKGSPNPPDG